MEKLYALVESAIERLGVNPTTCRNEKPGQWSLKKNAITVYVDMLHIEREGRAYFQVMAPIIKIPNTNQEAFYKELLEINDKLYGVAFTIYNGHCWIKIIREADGLDSNEALASITRVGTYGETYYKQLLDKYFNHGGFAPGPASDR